MMENVGRIVDDRYKLQDVIGTGGTGVVYRATQLTVDRVVALKIMRPFLDADDVARSRFEVEARAIGRLHHANCVTLFDFGYCDELGSCYMAMEYLEGVPLSEWTTEHEFDRDAVFSICYQIASGLHHAHEQGILHRDLKPENVIVTTDQKGRVRAKVLDFGLARLYRDTLQGADDPRITEQGRTQGTPSFMSPEQCRGSRTLSPATDVYSLGVMMWQMFEEQLPYRGRSATNVMLQHVNEPVPPMRSGRAPDAVEELIYSMLSKPPADRPASALEVAETLRPHAPVDTSGLVDVDVERLRDAGMEISERGEASAEAAQTDDTQTQTDEDTRPSVRRREPTNPNPPPASTPRRPRTGWSRLSFGLMRDREVRGAVTAVFIVACGLAAVLYRPPQPDAAGVLIEPDVEELPIREQTGAEETATFVSARRWDNPEAADPEPEDSSPADERSEDDPGPSTERDEKGRPESTRPRTLELHY